MRYDVEQVLQLHKLEVLAKDEMLHLASDLLENNHPELYAEFKRMITEAVGCVCCLRRSNGAVNPWLRCVSFRKVQLSDGSSSRSAGAMCLV